MSAVPDLRRCSALALALCICIGVAACTQRGSVGTAGSAAAPAQVGSIGGVWIGADASGRSFIGLANEAGLFHLIRQDGVQYVGTATARGGVVSAKAYRYLRTGKSAGTKFEAVSVKGKVKQRVSLVVTVTPAAGTPSFPAEKISLQFNPIYNHPSTLTMFSGHYMDQASGNSITVSGDGSIYWANPRNGCLANGQVSLIDPHYDVYFVQFSYSACRGVNADANGVEFRGLATLNTSDQPAQVIIGACGPCCSSRPCAPQFAGKNGYAIDMKLTKRPPPSPI